MNVDSSWQKIVQLYSVKPVKRPTWLQLGQLLALAIGGECLAEPEILELLAALKVSSLTAPHPAIIALKDQVP
jgi:hypothetical protein